MSESASAEARAEWSKWPPRDFVGYGSSRPHPRWPGNARVCISFCINYEEGGERSVVDGDAHSEIYLSEIPGRAPKTGRDPGVESEFEYGSRAGVWRLKRLFKQFGVRATIWAVGLAVDRNPQAIKALHEDGHEIASHGYRWSDYSEEPLFTMESSHVEQSFSSIERAIGHPPRGMYVGRHSVRLWDSIQVHTTKALKYVSDSYADDLPYYVRHNSDKPVLVIPYALDNNDMKFGMANSYGKPDDFFQQLKDSFDFLYEEGVESPSMMSIGLHCRISGRPARAQAVKRFLEYVTSKPGVWIATREEIADHWLKTHPFQRAA